MRNRLLTQALVALALLGCGSSDPGPAPSAPAPIAPAPIAPAPSSAPAPSTAPSPSSADAAPSLPEADVRALLDRWVAAQNAGDFDGYEQLYAARFDGIRRSGPRERRFDRAGWMADRRTMFARQMTVAVRDVSVRVVGSSATVHFVQTFTAGTYHDEGPKELVVVSEPGGLRIAREEMLSSTLGASSAAAPAVAAVMPIVSARGERFVVLARVPDGATWSEGVPSLVVRDQVVVTREAARVSSVPAELAALASQAVAISDATGAHCDAQLGALAVLSRVDVHFGVEQEWDGQRPDGTQGPHVSDARIARDAWGEGMLLVAPLSAIACPGAVYARLASAPAATAFTQSDAGALTPSIVAAFHALPAWTALNDAFHDEGNEGAWDEAEGAIRTIRVWSGGGRRFAVARAENRQGGCAEFGGALWSVWEVAGDQTLTRITDPNDPGDFAPTAAVDVDGDGAPEWIVPEGVVGRTPNGLGVTMDITPAMHDCDC